MLQNLRRRLERLERGQGDRIPWCLCNGQLNVLTVDAADYLARGKPETVCQACGKRLLLAVVVAEGEVGRAELAELEVRA
jgi:hypothetical protein